MLKKMKTYSSPTFIEACNRKADIVFSFIILKLYSSLIFVENLPDQNI